MKTRSAYLIVVILIIAMMLSNSYPQQISRIFENPGGGGGTTQPSTEQSSDNTTLYVIGGLLVAGIVVYALLRDNKDKAVDDSKALILNNDYQEKQLTLLDKEKNLQPAMPLQVILGIQNELIKKDEKRYFVGFAYNF